MEPIFNDAKLTKAEMFLLIEKIMDSDNIKQEQMCTIVELLNKNLLRQDNTNRILKIFGIIFTKIKGGMYPEFPLLSETVKSAMKMLVKVIESNEPQAERNEAIMKYLEFLLDTPENIYKKARVELSPLMLKLLDLYFDTSAPEKPYHNMVLTFFKKHLCSLSEKEQKDFVESGLHVWLSSMTNHMFKDDPNFSRKLSIDVAADILPILLKAKYRDSLHWLRLSKNFQDATKYPKVLLDLLNNNDPSWCRLWRFVIQILGTELHKIGGSINPLLFVLQEAFKKGISFKLEAFQCLKTLIDNFALDNKVLFNSSRIKVLSIAFESNNAKTEQVALLKFGIWWFLITLLRPNIKSHASLILLPFLKFCFSDPIKNPPPKYNRTYPGEFFASVQKIAIKSFVEICGHSNCSNCTGDGFKKLSHPILDSELLEQHHNAWIHALKQVTIYANTHMLKVDKNDLEESKQNLRCIWESFVKIAADVKNNQTFNTIFKNIMNLLASFVEEHAENALFAETLVTLIIPIVANRGYSVTVLNDPNVKLSDNLTPIKFLIRLILTPKLYHKDTMNKIHFDFKNLVEVGLLSGPGEFSSWIIDELTPNNHGPLLWCHLTDAVVRCTHFQPTVEIASKILNWPIEKYTDDLKAMDIITSWKKMYNSQKGRANKNNTVCQLDDMILDTLLTACKDNISANNLMFLNLLPVVLKKQAEDQPGHIDITRRALTEFKNCLNVYEVKKITNLQLIALCESLKAFRFVLGLCNTFCVSPSSADLLIITINSVLKILKYYFTTDYMDFINMGLEFFSYLNSLLDTLNNFDIPSYSDQIMKNVIELVYVLKKNVKDIDIAVKCPKLEAKLKVHEAMHLSERLPKEITAESKNVIKSPATPKITKKKASSKSKDVEEFVVIKPSWKFDPKNLTEHQKDVLKRRRDDIPALYEDLSQSQDESLMKLWKPPGYKSDSQGDSSVSQSISSDAVVADKKLSESNNIKISKSINIKAVSSTNNYLIKGNNTDVSSNKTKLPDSTFLVKANENSDIIKNGSRASQMIHLCQVENSEKPSIESLNNNVKSSETSIKLKCNINNAKIIVKNIFDKDAYNSAKDTSLNTSVSVVTNKSCEQLKTKDSKNSSNQNANSLPMKESNLNAIKEKEPSPKANIDFDKTDIENIEQNDSIQSPASTQKKRKSLLARLNENMKNLNGSFDKQDNTEKVDNLSITDIGNETNIIKDDAVSTDQTKLNNDITTSAGTTRPNRVKRKPNKFIVDEGFDTKKRKCGTPTNNDSEILSQDSDTKTETIPGKKVDTAPVLAPLEILNTNNESDCLSPEVVTLKIKKKKSRLINQLAIDTNEGHPLMKLNKTPKSSSNTRNTRRSLHMADNSNAKNASVSKNKKEPEQQSIYSQETPVFDELPKSIFSQDTEVVPNQLKCAEKNALLPMSIESGDLNELSENNTEIVKKEDGLNCSPDFIESSQEEVSFITTLKLSVSKTKETVQISKINLNKDETESKHETVHAGGIPSTEEVILSSQEVAEADTEPLNINKIDDNPRKEFKNDISNDEEPIIINDAKEEFECDKIDTKETAKIESIAGESMEDDIKHEEKCINNKINDVPSCFNNSIISSPCKEDTIERNLELFNDTIDLSPIKGITSSSEHSPISKTSPDKADNTVADVPKQIIDNSLIDNETSIKKPGKYITSPDLFSNEKVSPVKQNIQAPEVSPPKTSIALPTPITKPPLRNSWTSMMHAGSRTAQMIRLCISNDKEHDTENEESSSINKKDNSPINTSTSKSFLNIENKDIGNNQPLLEFSKIIPCSTASPVGPILKRKFESDDNTMSPSSKKKRVSFHDPPVSTMMSVEKYINPRTVKSPQSQSKILNGKNETSSPRPHRLIVVKSLIKTIEIEAARNTLASEEILPITRESSELENSPMPLVSDSQISDICSLIVDSPKPLNIITNHLLDDSLPVYPNLVNCQVCISEISSDLSSPLWKDNFLKEIKEKLSTIGDVAKLTELEVNRLPFKSPKLETVKKALSLYEEKMKLVSENADSSNVAINESKSSNEDKTTPLSDVENKDSIEDNCEALPFIENTEIVNDECDILTQTVKIDDQIAANAVEEMELTETAEKEELALLKDISMPCDKMDIIDDASEPKEMPESAQTNEIETITVDSEDDIDILNRLLASRPQEVLKLTTEKLSHIQLLESIPSSSLIDYVSRKAASDSEFNKEILTTLNTSDIVSEKANHLLSKMRNNLRNNFDNILKSLDKMEHP